MAILMMMVMMGVMMILMMMQVIGHFDVYNSLLMGATFVAIVVKLQHVSEGLYEA
jgi:hypothetical protein